LQHSRTHTHTSPPAGYSHANVEYSFGHNSTGTHIYVIKAYPKALQTLPNPNPSPNSESNPSL